MSSSNFKRDQVRSTRYLLVRTIILELGYEAVEYVLSHWPASQRSYYFNRVVEDLVDEAA